MISRRGLLVWLSSLVVAPAIVKFESLMPISPIETFGPNGLLTIEQITKELARQLWLAGGRPISDLLAIRGSIQKAVDFNYDTSARTMSLEKFSNGVIKPIARALLDRTSPPIPVRDEPRAYLQEAAIERYSGISVRGLTHYAIGTGSFLTRFDVTVD